jgi:hypothetical protein
MQNNDLFVRLLEEVVRTLGSELGDVRSQIASLAETTNIIEEPLPGESYKDGQLAHIRGGLFRMTNGDWRVVANGVAGLALNPTAKGVALALELSDGSRFEQEIKVPVPTRRRPVKAIH